MAKINPCATHSGLHFNLSRKISRSAVIAVYTGVMRLLSFIPEETAPANAPTGNEAQYMEVMRF